MKPKAPTKYRNIGVKGSETKLQAEKITKIVFLNDLHLDPNYVDNLANNTKEA